jgi:hypothetical protein
MNQLSVFAKMKGQMRNERTVREKGDRYDGIRDDSEGGVTVDCVLIEVSTYLGDNGGRRRNKGFGGLGRDTNWRRRSNRQRRVILWRR